ncbi:hypothetical protein BV25DRAFT_1869425 [Artomyces pyxidatus]|uniref:Uncharacterized protein n=1 Tax=Artomyces pyxidatus TaxID=48021 RepID=A0ACB8T774_9AGAM|nr:hypothetical protein BV25DRAFT_1869425 [Artomyces pyxidatus]
MALNAVKRFRMRELTSIPVPALGSTSAKPLPKATSPLAVAPATKLVRVNPFVPHKNPETGRWAPPRYSLRRQADLVKQARASGTLHLLPPGPKFIPPAAAKPKSKRKAESEEEVKVWEAPVEWEGAVKVRSVAGADVGNRLYAGKKRMFKGHKWERTREKRVRRTKVMLRDMRKRIVRYKTHHAKRRPKPLRPAPAAKKAPKLPF